jgi:hypothetical protein
MNKTQTLSASRAGLGSVIIVSVGATKTQAISNVGVIVSGGVVAAPFVLHPFV